MPLREKCSQDHRKIQAGAIEGMTIRCGLCGLNLSKNVTQAILSAKKTADYMTPAEQQHLRDAGRGHLI
jgi:hypothetical protein